MKKCVNYFIMIYVYKYIIPCKTVVKFTTLFVIFTYSPNNTGRVNKGINVKPDLCLSSKLYTLSCFLTVLHFYYFTCFT